MLKPSARQSQSSLSKLRNSGNNDEQDRTGKLSKSKRDEVKALMELVDWLSRLQAGAHLAVVETDEFHRWRFGGKESVSHRLLHPYRQPGKIARTNRTNSRRSSSLSSGHAATIAIKSASACSVPPGVPPFSECSEFPVLRMWKICAGRETFRS